MSRLAFAFVFACSLAGVAHGQPQTTLVKPPAGWRSDTAQASALSDKANTLAHFGGVKAMATAEVFLAPQPGVALLVTLVVGKVDEHREAAARVAVDELHATSQRATLAGSGGGIVEDRWQERVDPDTKQIEAQLAWRDAGAGTKAFLKSTPCVAS